VNTRFITNSEIAQRQEDVRIAAHRARNEMTVAGIRRIVGGTFIAIGLKLQGCIDHQRAPISVPTAVIAARSN
jgi:hypothetical protein